MIENKLDGTNVDSVALAELWVKVVYLIEVIGILLKHSSTICYTLFKIKIVC